jgi:small redox-active disulfide protein 2
LTEDAVHIAIVGSGCPTCHELERRVRDAVRLSGLDASIQTLKEPPRALGEEVRSTPALIVDGAIVCQGMLPSTRLIGEWLASMRRQGSEAHAPRGPVP